MPGRRRHPHRQRASSGRTRQRSQRSHACLLRGACSHHDFRRRRTGNLHPATTNDRSGRRAHCTCPRQDRPPRARRLRGDRLPHPRPLPRRRGRVEHLGEYIPGTRQPGADDRGPMPGTPSISLHLVPRNQSRRPPRDSRDRVLRPATGLRPMVGDEAGDARGGLRTPDVGDGTRTHWPRGHGHTRLDRRRALSRGRHPTHHRTLHVTRGRMLLRTTPHARALRRRPRLSLDPHRRPLPDRAGRRNARHRGCRHGRHVHGLQGTRARGISPHHTRTARSGPHPGSRELLPRHDD